MECVLQKCNQCPCVETFANGFVAEIEYEKWAAADISMLETIHQSVDEFTQSFTEHLQHLILHDFIVKVQTTYSEVPRGDVWREAKENVLFLRWLCRSIQEFHELVPSFCGIWS